jgi:hypothetical protein
MFASLFNNAETCLFITQYRHFIFVVHAAKFSVFGGVGGWEIYLIYRILSFTGSLHPVTAQWLRGLCIVAKDYVRL